MAKDQFLVRVTFDILVLKLCIEFATIIAIASATDSEGGFILGGEYVCESGQVLGRITAGGAFFGESFNADYGSGRRVGACPFG